MSEGKISAGELEEQIKNRDKVFGILIEKLKPWLFEFGNWIFGGLIAFNLVIVAPLLTLNAMRPEVLVSLTAFACALPLNVSGVFLLKLIKDMNGVEINDVMKQAFQDADIPVNEAHILSSDTQQALQKKRTDVGLRYSVRLVAVSGAITLIGMVAALWYIAWWIAAIFIAMVILSCALTMTMITRLMRPDSDSDQELIQRYQENIAQSRNKAGKAE